MKKINYLSATQLLERARDIMVPIPSQLQAQKEIATLIAMHLNNVKSIERGVPASQLPHVAAFIMGSTGSGKSYITKSLASICNISYERVDSTSITQTGCRGKNLSQVFSSIIERDPTFFTEGASILFFDEADKIFYTGDPHHDAYNPMRDFLTLFENGEYTYSIDGKNQTINLDRTLILLGGACAKLPELLEKEFKTKKPRVLGFGSEFDSSEDNKNVDVMSNVTMEHLVKYGCMSELASRLQTLIYIPDIDIQGYKQLITDTAKTSALSKYKNAFDTRGVKLKIKDSAVELIAQNCLNQKLGARSIESVINKALLTANNYIDDNPSFNKVVLYAHDNKFKINYYKGERKVTSTSIDEIPNINFDNIDLTEQFETQHTINSFCYELTEHAQLSTGSQKELFHSFLQATCYYLANEVRPSDKTYNSLIKLANATDNEDNSNCVSPYNIICNDYLKKYPDDLNIEDKFLPYYINVKRFSHNANISTFLVNSLRIAAKNYEIAKTKDNTVA